MLEKPAGEGLTPDQAEGTKRSTSPEECAALIPAGPTWGDGVGSGLEKKKKEEETIAFWFPKSPHILVGSYQDKQGGISAVPL